MVRRLQHVRHRDRRETLRQHDRERRVGSLGGERPALRYHADHDVRPEPRVVLRARCPVEEADRIELLLGDRPRLALDRRHRYRRGTRGDRQPHPIRRGPRTGPGRLADHDILRIRRDLVHDRVGEPVTRGERLRLRRVPADEGGHRERGRAAYTREGRRGQRDRREEHDGNDERHQPALPPPAFPGVHPRGPCLPRAEGSAGGGRTAAS